MFGYYFEIHPTIKQQCCVAMTKLMKCQKFVSCPF